MDERIKVGSQVFANTEAVDFPFPLYFYMGHVDEVLRNVDMPDQYVVNFKGSRWTLRGDQLISAEEVLERNKLDNSDPALLYPETITVPKQTKSDNTPWVLVSLSFFVGVCVPVYWDEIETTVIFLKKCLHIS